MTLSLDVRDRPAVLARIAGVFVRRNLNIRSLSALPGERGRSRIQIEFESDPDVRRQVANQLDRLLDVVAVHGGEGGEV